MTVDDLRQRMSGQEFAYWYVYHGRRAQQQELAAAQAKGK